MNEYMMEAIRLSSENFEKRYGGPFGACVVKDGVIIGRGINQVIKNCDPSAHAEVMAIRDACKTINSHDLTGCELYTSCYPCPMCLSTIIWSNIKKVYYGNTKEDAEKIGFIDNYIYETIDKLINGEESRLELKCIDREETLKVFRKFEEKSDKKLY